MPDTNTRADQNETPESKYPLQEIHQFSGGHRIWVGNERGKEFMRVMHPSGSYIEIKPDGGVTHFSIGESKQYNKGGVTLTVDENNDVHISGHQKLQVGGGSHIEVAGDAGIVAGGAVALAAMGDLGMAVNGNGYFGIKGSANFNAAGGFKFEGPSGSFKISSIDITGNIQMAGDFNQSGTHTDSIGKHVG